MCKKGATMERRADFIKNIIDTEWDMFQKVNNIGGRASCQDDYDTFFIMRFGQYNSWTDEMLELYHDFSTKCIKEGRNLVSEKYGQMMQFTDLHYYNKHLKASLPFVPLANFRRINNIVNAMIHWEKEFVEKYPLIGNTGRPITSDGDKTGFTSMETYARGELMTYPEELLKMYEEYIEELKREGKSLSIMIQETIVQLYGYDSIEEAEASLM